MEKYFKECEVCQKVKLAPVKRGELTILKPTEPNEIISLDTAGPLPPYKHLLVKVCCFTKYLKLLALKNLEAKEIADTLVEYLCRHRVPHKLLTD